MRRRTRDGTRPLMRIVSMLLAVVTVLGIVPFTPLSVNVSALETSGTNDWFKDGDDTFNNPFIRALFYLGYRGGDLSRISTTGVNGLFGYSRTGGRDGFDGDVVSDQSDDAINHHNTGIKHVAANALTGLNTVSASTNDSDSYHRSTPLTSVTGQKPDVQLFRDRGLVCASYLAYVFLNYLPNIEGIETIGLADALTSGYASEDSWAKALQNMVSNGTATEVAHIKSDVTGAQIEEIYNSKGKSTTFPMAIEALVDGIENVQAGDIIVFGNPDKTGNARQSHVGICLGRADAGKSNMSNVLMMTHLGNNDGPEIQIVGYMAAGFTASGSGKPSVPLNIYRLYPQEQTGYLDIIKTTTNGGTLSGWEFSIYSDAACTDRVAVYSTGDGGTIDNVELKPGTYYVKETGGYYTGDKSYWVMDTSVKEVTIEAGKTATVSFENKWTGKVLFAKTSTNGGTVEGWKFTVYYYSDGTGEIGTYTTGPDGTILTKSAVQAPKFIYGRQAA